VRLAVAIAVKLELRAREHAVEQFDVITGKRWVRGLRIFRLRRFGLTPGTGSLPAIA